MTGGEWTSVSSRRMLVAGALVTACLLSACASGPRAADKPTVTVAPPATSTPFPTATPVSDPMAVCTSDPGARVRVSSTHVGALDGGWQALSSSLALKPQPGALSLDHQQNATLALKGITLLVGLGVSSHGGVGNICAVTVKIVGYKPLSAPIPNVTRTCSDLFWLDPGGVETGADCGAIGAVGGRADLAFTSSAVGTSASAALHDLNNPQTVQPVQVTTSDGQPASVWAHVEVPTSGTYTFSVGIWQDRSGPVVFATLQATFDVDALHEWSGRACAAPAMLAQLPPPASPPSTFICPGDPPTQE